MQAQPSDTRFRRWHQLPGPSPRVLGCSYLPDSISAAERTHTVPWVEAPRGSIAGRAGQALWHPPSQDNKGTGRNMVPPGAGDAMGQQPTYPQSQLGDAPFSPPAFGRLDPTECREQSTQRTRQRRWVWWEQNDPLLKCFLNGRGKDRVKVLKI